MTNREFYYQHGEIVYNNDYASIYYRLVPEDELVLVTCIYKNGDEDILEAVDKWLNQEFTGATMYLYGLDGQGRALYNLFERGK